jgi:hypothetical protein
MLYLTVNSTGATGYINTGFWVHVPRGRPVAEALFLIARVAGFHPPQTFTQSDNLMDLKIQDASTNDLDYGQSWAENGIHNGDTILLVDV